MKKPAKPAPDPQSCASCRFHQPNQTDEYGFCRRYPPTAHEAEEGSTVVLWPITALPEWCGEYARQTH